MEPLAESAHASEPRTRSCRPHRPSTVRSGFQSFARKAPQPPVAVTGDSGGQLRWVRCRGHPPQPAVPSEHASSCGFSIPSVKGSGQCTEPLIHALWSPTRLSPGGKQAQCAPFPGEGAGARGWETPGEGQGPSRSQHLGAPSAASWSRGCVAGMEGS